MARVVLRTLPYYRCWTPSFLHPPSSLTNSCLTNQRSSMALLFHNRSGRQGIYPKALKPSDLVDGENSTNVTDSEDEKKSRNQKKREARRAVRWGMELSSFSATQIKRILRVASLDNEVFEALMIVKRLGPDVREGKRRQYNYIGKLLRDVEPPELIDALILATKDGDWSRLKPFPVSDIELDVDAEEEYEEQEELEEDPQQYIEVVTRWFDGLVCKDIQVMNEVYAIRDVDFDRQELRKLVRRVHEVKESLNNTQENNSETERSVTGAEKSLIRFLRTLARQMPLEYTLY